MHALSRSVEIRKKLARKVSKSKKREFSTEPLLSSDPFQQRLQTGGGLPSWFPFPIRIKVS
jgi:hypothetical protein